MRNAGVLGLGGVVLALFLALGIQSCRLEKERERRAAAALRADSTAAANDISRDVNAKAAKLLGDSLAGVEKLAIQVKPLADALDKALERERIALARIKADSIARTGRAAAPTTVSAGDVRSAAFAVRMEPFTATLAVRLPPPPDSARLDSLRIVLDPATLEVRLGCGAAKDGIRPATASVTGPRWLPLTLGRVEQSPDLCRSPALQKPGVSRVRWFGIGAGTTGLLVIYYLLQK